MNLNQIHNVYFIGIGGIGMSALARYFQYIGKKVVGYDKTPTQLTDELQEIGLEIHFEELRVRMHRISSSLLLRHHIRCGQ